jgi:murein DD-endopeptidase MepM/ murein hydrolase activator NlpD
VVFRYHPAGSLTPGSGTGSGDATVHAPDMMFPIIGAPSYPQSQVYNFGGGQVGGDQCDARNYADPWRDNFCETRSSGTTPFCPKTGAHLGQDIRAGDRAGCQAMRAVSTPADRMVYRVVAVEDGTISNIGRYTVNLRAGGRIYRYLHLNMAKLDVELGDEVKAGDPIGWLSNDFGGTPTTFHLHFEIKLNTVEHGWVYVSPYMSLVRAYERMQAGAGEAITEANVGTASVPGQP